MKRSKSVALVLMSTTALTLTACEEPQVDAMIFQDPEQCAQEMGFSSQQCLENWEAAQKTHVEASPKYTSKADCEADFGAEQCEDAPYQTSSGGSIFMPMMMGYMMGSMLGGGRSGFASQPLYRSTSDPKNFRTADNHNVGSKTGATKVAQTASSRPSTKTNTVSRGGFGARARSGGFSSMGG